MGPAAAGVVVGTGARAAAAAVTVAAAGSVVRLVTSSVTLAEHAAAILSWPPLLRSPARDGHGEPRSPSRGRARLRSQKRPRLLQY
jgi:hypothetical protein